MSARTNAQALREADFVRLTSTRVQRAYYVRTVRANHETALTHCWAFDDDLPAAWLAICADETVLSAQLFPSSQRHKPHQKRKLTATYTREMEVSA